MKRITTIKSGIRSGGTSINHNTCPIVRSAVRAGGTSINHNGTTVRR